VKREIVIDAPAALARVFADRSAAEARTAVAWGEGQFFSGDERPVRSC